VGLLQRGQVGRREHAGVGHDDHVLDVVAFLELLDDRDDRGCLGLVALVAANLEGKPVAVDEQTDDDLGGDAAFLGVADLAQVVLLLRLEVQRGHVQQAQRAITTGHCVGEAQLGDRRPVGTAPSPAAARARVRRIVFSLAGLTPRSLSTRPVSRIEVGSTIRAITRSRNTASPRASNPSSVNTALSASYSTREEVPTTRGGAIGPRSRAAEPGSSKSAATGGRPISGTLGAAGSRPRSNSPCPGSSNSSRARATSSPSSASVCADPTWATIRRRPSTYSAICTA